MSTQINEFDNPMGIDGPVSNDYIECAKESVVYLVGNRRHPDADCILAVIDGLIRDREILADALKKVRAWEFDIMNDCVADAQKLAHDAITKAMPSDGDAI